MTDEPFCCPYCNAYMTIPPGTQPGQRVPCPRCGEMVRAAARPERAASPQAAPAAPVQQHPPSPTPTRWSNRAVAGAILGLMLILAALALVYALETVPVRRAHDVMKPPRSEFISVPLVLRIALGVYLFLLAFILGRSYFQRQRDSTQPRWRIFVLPTVLTAVGAVFVVLLLQPRRNPEPEKPELIPVRPVPPGELSGLGYLPEDVNLIAGIHLAEALQSPAGQALRSSLSFAESGLQFLEDLTQFKRDEIDHVVVGVHATNDVPPPLTLVVRTRRPYEEQKVRAAHPQQWVPPATDKPLYGIELKLGRFKVLAALWCADARTLVVFVNVKPDQIRRVPAVPPSGSERLAAPLRDLLQQRMGEGVQAWVVGDPESWDKSALWHPSNWDSLADLLSVAGPKPLGDHLPLPALNKEERQLAQLVRTFGAWMRLGQDINWHAIFNCGTPAVAQALDKRLHQRSEEMKVEMAITRRDSWVAIEGRAEAEKTREALTGTK
jgi:hypothetical protein